MNNKMMKLQRMSKIKELGKYTPYLLQKNVHASDLSPWVHSFVIT